MVLIPYSEFKKGSRIIYDNQPYEIIEASAMFKGRGSSVLQVRLKNLITVGHQKKKLKKTFG